jgi:phage gpG-like protein
MREFNILEFVTFLGVLKIESEVVNHVALERAAKIIEKESKDMLGHEHADWPPLAEATRADRERRGFDSDGPLLRTGQLRESISHTSNHEKAIVGSNLDRAVYHEFGTSRMPPRSFLADAAKAKLEEVVDTIGHTVVHHVVGKGIPQIEGE